MVNEYWLGKRGVVVGGYSAGLVMVFLEFGHLAKEVKNEQGVVAKVSASQAAGFAEQAK